MYIFTKDELDEFFSEEDSDIIRRLYIKLERCKEYNRQRESDFSKLREDEYDIRIWE